MEGSSEGVGFWEVWGGCEGDWVETWRTSCYGEGEYCDSDHDGGDADLDLLHILLSFLFFFFGLN